jgi:H+/Cl- antiporter ClcA
MAVTPFVRLEPPAQRVIATAGSFSAVSALFGGPLVAGLLLLEAGIAAGSALIPMLLPGLVAAAVGYVLFVGLGDWGGLSTTGLAVPGLPAYQGTYVVDLLLAIVVGVATSLLMEPVRMAAKRVFTIAPDIRSPRALWVLLAGGVAVGLLAETARLLGADSQDVLFSGQSAVPDVVAEQSATVVLVLLVTKAVGYAICLGCGFRGGPVFPAIFLGIALATFAVIGLDRSPTWAVAVGAAAGMTAGTGLIFSAMLFAMLLVGGIGLDALPAAVLASVAAWIVKTSLERKAGDAAADRPAPSTGTP